MSHDHSATHGEATATSSVQMAAVIAYPVTQQGSRPALTFMLTHAALAKILLIIPN